jgi:hypothetical protein
LLWACHEGNIPFQSHLKKPHTIVAHSSGNGKFVREAKMASFVKIQELVGRLYGTTRCHSRQAAIMELTRVIPAAMPTLGGELALQKISRRKPTIKNRVEGHIEKGIV